MAPPPGPYAGTSTLALVARVSAFSVGVVYGSIKLKYLKMEVTTYFYLLDGGRLWRAFNKFDHDVATERAKAKSDKKAESTAHH